MKKYYLLLLLLYFYTPIFATHNRAGEITYQCVNSPTNTYSFKIVTYTYTPSPADRPELPISWGDGSVDTIQRSAKIAITNLIQRNEYVGIVILALVFIEFH